MSTPASMSTPTRPIARPDQIRPAFTFFKVMAFVVGIGLLVLAVEMILSYGVGLKGRENPLWWWPQPHGFLFMVYAAATLNLGLKVRWGIGKVVTIMLAGCVPLLSFVAEARVAREIRELLATQDAR